MTTPITKRFKKIDPTAPVQEKAQTYTAGYTAFKMQPAAFSNGSMLVRFLPQTSDSPYSNCVDVNILAAYNNPKLTKTGRIAVRDEDGWFFGKVSKLLKSHGEFKYCLASKTNPEGASFWARPKVLFLGFDVAASDPKVMPYLFPGTNTYSKDKNAQVGAGTIIQNFSFDLDFQGNIKYGDIFDIETGRAIRLDVSNAGKMLQKITPSVDAVYPIHEKQYFLLEEIVSFDDVINYATLQEMVEYTKDALPEDAFDYLDSAMNFDKILNGIKQLSSKIEAAINV